VISVSAVHRGPSRLGVPDSRPLANTAFVVKKGNDTITSFTTGDQAAFGFLWLQVTTPFQERIGKDPVESYGPFEVDVAAGQIKKVQWNCDTGM